MEINGMKILEKDYIGDGVYTLYDGSGIWLHANHHEHPSDRVYLEPEVLIALNRFAIRVGMGGADENNKRVPG
jgi:hypothetical protein